MANATATKTATGSESLFLALADGEKPVSELLAGSSEKVIAAAWNRGEIELGRIKHVYSGNREITDFTHNGVLQAKPAVILEDGIEWPLPAASIKRFAPLSKVIAEKLPVAPRYQKYQLEVCVNKEKDIWEWLEPTQNANGREVRWARRDIDRAEAERLWVLYARLTDKGYEILRAE